MKLQLMYVFSPPPCWRMRLKCTPFKEETYTRRSSCPWDWHVQLGTRNSAAAWIHQRSVPQSLLSSKPAITLTKCLSFFFFNLFLPFFIASDFDSDMPAVTSRRYPLWHYPKRWLIYHLHLGWKKKKKKSSSLFEVSRKFNCHIALNKRD